MPSLPIQPPALVLSLAFAAAAGPSFSRPNARSSATFEPTATTGGLGLANVAWLGLQRLGARGD